MFKAILFILSINSILFSQDDSWKLYDDEQVDEVYITIDSVRLDWVYENVQSDSIHPVIVRYVSEWFDETLNNVGFRLRGNTSRVSAKKSFKLDFNHFEQGRSFYGVEKLNLNGEHNDPSIIRSKLCWDIYQDLGMTASRATHTAVFINEVFYGLYISVEHIDEEFLEKNFSDDSGNLWKCLWPADLNYRGNNPGDYHPYYDEERPYELKTNKEEYDYSQIARLIRIINQTPWDTFSDSLEAVLDVASVLKYFAVNVLTGNWDDYWFLRNNYYLYHQPDEDRFYWVPYDYDNSIGIDWFDIDWTETDPFNFPIIDGDGRPLAERIMEHDEYRDLYTHFIDFISTNIFELSHWEDRMDNLKFNMDPWVEIDEYRTYDYGFTLEDYHNSFSADHFQNLHVKRGIREFVNLRMESLINPPLFTGAPPVVYDYSWSPEHLEVGDSIFIQASVFGSMGLQSVSIYFYETADSEPEIIPMFFSPVEETKIVEESDRWLGAIPSMGYSPGYFQIHCEDSNGQSNLFPRHNLIELTATEIVTNEVILNEFLAINDTTNFDEEGEFDDWIELYNPGNELADIGGMYLTDNPDNLTKWMIPAETLIPSQGHLLIWCDDDEDQGFLHTNFKLNAEGEYLILVQTDGYTIYDSLSFGEQELDISFGRISDGEDEWDIQVPSPGTSNNDETGSVEISFFAGWNLIGLPMNTGSLYYEIIFPNSVSETLFGFDEIYFETDFLIPGHGYWLYFDEAGSDFITGNSIHNLIITLHQGWNLISGVTAPISVYDIVDPDEIVIQGSWYGFDETYFNSDSLFPGKGYWVNASSSGEITISSAQSSLSAKLFSPPSYLNTLTLEHMVLYFGNRIEVENPLSYLLPPKPPTGGKDIRFSGDSKLCSTDECLIKMMNDGSPLIFDYEIKDGEFWEIIPIISNQSTSQQVEGGFYLSGGTQFTLDSNTEEWLLRKSSSLQHPTKFAFFPAHPNPFNSNTTIRFSVPEKMDVNVSVYDIQGRIVEKLINKQFTLGNYNIQWNAKDFSSGIYFVLIEGNGKKKSQKIILMK